METSSVLHEKAARYRRLAAVLFDDARVSEAMAAMADEFDARAAECAAREVTREADPHRSADATDELRSPADVGIYRTAIVLVKEYGPTQAPLAAAQRAQDVGDLEGQLMWKGVRRAVEELTRTERRSDERVN